MVTLNEIFDEDDPGVDQDFQELIIVLSAAELDQVAVPLLEGHWTPSAVKGLYVRLDPARPELKQDRHVHVAQKKHLRSPDKQVSWTDRGRRHDRHSFNAKFGARADVQTAARAALGLPPTFLLEAAPRAVCLLTESASHDPRTPAVVRRASQRSIAARIAAAAPAARPNLVHEELRAMDGRDVVLRVYDSGDEFVAHACGSGAEWGVSVSATHDVVSDSAFAVKRVTPETLAESLADILLDWLHDE